MKMSKNKPWFWPNAVADDGQKLFTYECVPTICKALKQFSIWEDNYGYKIKTAWIETTDGDLIHVKRQWSVAEVEAGSDD